MKYLIFGSEGTILSLLFLFYSFHYYLFFIIYLFIFILFYFILFYFYFLILSFLLLLYFVFYVIVNILLFLFVLSSFNLFLKKVHMSKQSKSGLAQHGRFCPFSFTVGEPFSVCGTLSSSPWYTYTNKP